MNAPNHGYVLLVEDDDDLAEILMAALEDEGYRVVLARNGAEALRTTETAMPALVLLDMFMPVMDGFEFARRFEEHYGRAAPIVVMTASENARRLAEQVAADDVLAKPFGTSLLLRIVSRFVRAERL